MSIRKRVLDKIGAYELYSRRLEQEIRSGEMPNHLAVILDGNRRWAKRVGMLDVHSKGADVTENLIEWCEEFGIRIITIYALSTENLGRDDAELESLYGLMLPKLEKLYHDPRLHKWRMRVKGIGRLELLPPRIRDILAKLDEVTREYDRCFFNIALAYGGHNEMIDAVRKIAADARDGKIDAEMIDKEMIESRLYTSHLPQSSPDVILRTSGEMRLSGFLLWQAAYSEMVFTDVFWPGFRKIDLMRTIRTYQKRKRRRGL